MNRLSEYYHNAAEILRSSERMLRRELDGAADGMVWIEQGEVVTCADNLAAAARLFDTLASKATEEAAE